jgi:hypothetical protein
VFRDERMSGDGPRVGDEMANASKSEFEAAEKAYLDVEDLEGRA